MRRQPLSDQAIASRTFEEEYLFGEATDTLEALLESQGVSRAELAERLQRSRGRVSQALSGKENLTMRSLAALGWALGVRFELQPKPVIDRQATPAAADPPLPQWLSRMSVKPVPTYRQVPQRSAEAVASTAWRRAHLRARGDGQVVSSVAS